MPTRTRLPRNLTRHFYEARRAFLQSAGQETTPWFQLSPEERAVVESELSIFRLGIRWAEDEEDLLTSLDATRAAVANEPAAEETPKPAAADEGAPGECCLGCAAVAAVMALIEAMGTKPEPAAETPVENRFPFNIAEVTTAPLDTHPSGVPLSEEKTRVHEAGKDKLPAWLMTAGIGLDALDDAAPRIPVTFDARPISVERLLVEGSPFEDGRADFWLWKPNADKV
ncbi:hypothetical protein [Streptomyces sp. NPDC016172]|uniref:hypothetical protein n=1 Tax=Streptomyces sp. NPDC016172 TaxID=3364964 RepID=UPI0036FD8EBD